MLLTALSEALHESLGALPWLLAIYAVLEIVEQRMEGRVKSALLAARAVGPLLGALLGCIPQCGFSVIATALYAQRVISRGTLLAVYLSTSDEAIPVILAHPEQAHLVMPLVAAKLVIGAVAGYLVDLLPAIHRANRLQPHDPECRCLDESHWCGHHHGRGAWWRQFVAAPLRHAGTVLAFIFLVSLLLNLIIAAMGPENMARVFLPHSVWQPLAAVAVGLIPNCAASVAVTEIFLRGGITFGSALAGLCASAGLGLLVLLKETDRREALGIIAELAVISFLAGEAVNFVLRL